MVSAAAAVLAQRHSDHHRIKHREIMVVYGGFCFFTRSYPRAHFRSESLGSRRDNKAARSTVLMCASTTTMPNGIKQRVIYPWLVFEIEVDAE